jgi:pimeloyl-ACP methyl ester carboxylesterase
VPPSTPTTTPTTRSTYTRAPTTTDRRLCAAYTAWLVVHADANPDAFVDVVGAEAAVTAWRRHPLHDHAPATVNQALAAVDLLYLHGPRLRLDVKRPRVPRPGQPDALTAQQGAVERSAGGSYCGVLTRLANIVSLTANAISLEVVVTEFLDVDGGRIAYEVAGDGPLAVLSHGMADTRRAWRFLAPRLVAAGYRVATPDLRGLGESSVGFPAYSRTETANDLLALIRHLGGPAVIVGHSYSGGAATIAAAQAPELVSAIVELAAFTRAQKLDLAGLVRNRHHRKGIVLLLGTGILGNTGLCLRYLRHAYPGVKPADWDEQLAALRANLAEPGRMKVLQAMGRSAPTDAGAALPLVHCPALVVAGTLDPDWADPAAEADGIAAGLPAGRAKVAMIDGAGHYPHVQYPDRFAAILLPFLKEHAGA